MVLAAMDKALKEAAEQGKIDILMGVEGDLSGLLTEWLEGKEESGNIFHFAAWNGRVQFMDKAIKELPTKIRNTLLFHVDRHDWTPLHAAASEGKSSYEMVKKILDYYNLMPPDDMKPPKPWLQLAEGKTPLHMALEKNWKGDNENSALELLEMDVEVLSNTDAEDGNSPLFLAVKNGYTQVAEKILTSSPLSSISISGKDDLTPLHFAPNCSKKVFKWLLRNKFAECINKINKRGYSVLHQWAEIGEAWPCELLLNCRDFAEARTKIFKDLVCSQENNDGDTPLHISAKKRESELGQVLVRGYQQVIKSNEAGIQEPVSERSNEAEIQESVSARSNEAEIQELVSARSNEAEIQESVSARSNEAEIQESVSAENPPWRIQNNVGDIPLVTAMYRDGRHELAVEILSIDPTTCQIQNNRKESIFFIAVMVKCELAVEEILKTEALHYDMLRRNDGTTVLHYLHGLSEKTGTRLLERYWWINNLADDKTLIDTATENNALWLVNLLKDPSLIETEPFDWIEACKRKETLAIFAFVENCSDLQKVCREKTDTPLHHIEFLTYKDYRNFLKIPSIVELKNTIDHEGSTPLHRALERKNIVLSKILLHDNAVERTIPNKNGTEAMDLLADLCDEHGDWEKMCQQIKVNPYLKTTYIHQGTNLDQMRTTLSVVAALLATITFAAGFTLPGGINSATGKALLAKEAAFLIFLLTDVFAMCTSILVLFCLIWSMVSEPDMARVLVDRSAYILVFSLYGTLLAFMTGIYTVIPQSSLWAAILVIVMCSVIAILASCTILYKEFAKWGQSCTILYKEFARWFAKVIPTPSTRKKDPMSSIEEGDVGESSTGKDASNKTD